jgi:transaldolase
MDHGPARDGRGDRNLPPDLNALRVKIFADGADRDMILKLLQNPLIKGFTTNPTLMHAAGLRDYEAFAREILEFVVDHPVSFEVFSDDFGEMERQAAKIASWGVNVFVKVPVTNTRAESALATIRRLAGAGVRLNVTALMTVRQVDDVSGALAGGPPSFISVFAGRIADTGRDPVPMMRQALDLMSERPEQELVWASSREVLNIVQADAIGCDVITVTHDLLKKLPIVGRDLDQYSLETVRMFFDDARSAGFTL